MSYFDYDYPELSELDILVDETTNKIKDMIINQSKDKVDEILKTAAREKERADRAMKRLREYEDKSINLQKENQALKDELDKKRTSLNELPFEIGEEAYFVVEYDCEQVVCPECKGKGTIKVSTEKYGDVEVICPVCNNRTYYSNSHPLRDVTYHTVKPRKFKIDRIHVHITSDNKQFSYDGDTGCRCGCTNIFRTYEECEMYCEKENADRKKKAQMKLEGKK